MKKLLSLFAAVLLIFTAGCGQSALSGSVSAAASPGQQAVLTEELDALLSDILGAVPGTAGSSLKQARAAGELLDWAQAGNRADESTVKRWIADNAAQRKSDLVWSYAAVLDFADRILQGDPNTAGELEDAGYQLRSEHYDATAYDLAVQMLSPLFTCLLDNAGPIYTCEAAGEYSEITLDKFQGIWCDGQDGEMLILSDGLCRVVAPRLDEYGDEAYAVRLRDRSASGYCPALEIDVNGQGDFTGALTYYVSGIDASHFWCNTQTQRFNAVTAN